MMEALISFLQAIYKTIKIKQIVADFVMDTNGQVWLTDVKWLKMMPVVKLSNLAKMTQEGLHERIKHMLKQRDKVQKCFMCNLYKQ